MPFVATLLTAADAPVEEYVHSALDILANTALVDLTGQPAINIPAGLADCLPVGMMIVAPRFKDALARAWRTHCQPLCFPFKIIERAMLATGTTLVPSLVLVRSRGMAALMKLTNAGRSSNNAQKNEEHFISRFSQSRSSKKT